MRTINALNGVARVETALHTCNRSLGMASSMCVEDVIDWEADVLHANHGQHTDFHDNTKAMCHFVRG